MVGFIFGFFLLIFWVGLMLILLFVVEFGWLLFIGCGDIVLIFGIQISLVIWDGFSYIFLLVLNLVFLKILFVICFIWVGVCEVMSQDYVKYVCVKGVFIWWIVFVYVMKNIMILVVIVMGLEFGSFIGFFVVIEIIFVWFGMGKFLIDVILQLDWLVVVVYLMIMVVFFVLINLVVDIFYFILDLWVCFQDQGV